MNDIFIDSNIVLYLMDSDLQKRSISKSLLLQQPCISPQVLTEVANVCKRKFKYDKEQILRLWTDLLTDCKFIGTTQKTFHSSIALTRKYNFQLFDALIVASALEANCSILYSEDMHHNLVVEKRLTIVNPFV